MSLLPGMRGLARRLITPFLPSVTTPATATHTQPFSSTIALLKKKKKGSMDKATAENMAKVRQLKTGLFARAPPTLRMARNRWLRHWTIHRAWMLHTRAVQEANKRELMRMQQGMSNACEELRKTVGPAGRDEGYLYRVAMEKANVYNNGSVPIEYARFQTETPAKVAWDHNWKR
ncbi:RING finger domain-containingprotein [Ceratocystis lukuohia]|uniref:Uncharacterized protein n=2 Tax=Ceratocystis TaxID=5157 RepID=A0A0F8B077_CERFI|nr:hypothetical protein CFO_g4898 [Ceratocystis platani]